MNEDSGRKRTRRTRESDGFEGEGEQQRAKGAEAGVTCGFSFGLAESERDSEQ
jgi:hypothetical protein